jgi:NADH-quinone oxidoreductase subunit G
MVVRTATERVKEARKAVLELLLTNHPLDCPVCDKGGECELQDLTLAHGPGVGRFAEAKRHVEERQWSAVVYYDRPRCILCFRCVRICDWGLGVRALSIIDRGGHSEIAPNRGDHLECDECGACIDICPVGALTSRMYRYQTRPWEMRHAATICTHCGDGCKTTLGVYHNQIMRGNNRDRSGLNGEFLCLKGRYAADFVEHPERLTTPLMRTERGLEPATWARAIAVVAGRLREVKAGGAPIGVIGSNHTTNEENYFLQKLAREALGTPHIDHHRTGDVASLAAALAGRPQAWATVEDLYTSKAVLVVGADLAQQHPMLSFQIRFNYHHHGARVYVVTRGPVREDKYAARSLRVEPGRELEGVESLLPELAHESELVVLFGDAIRGAAVAELVALAESLGIPVKYVCLVDYSNSRGAADMGLLPDLGPGYQPAARGMNLDEMLACQELGALWVVGANPLKDRALAAQNAFVVVQELFLTETARRADVVLPAACAYEKTGTVTNTCGQVQRLTRALARPGPKADLEIFRLIAQALGETWGGLPARAGPAARPLPDLGVRPRTGGPPHYVSPAGCIRSAGDTLFTSGSLGRYSKTLQTVAEAPGGLYRG